MAARASASDSSDDNSRSLLLALSHDELGVIFDGLADPLQPVVAVALSSTCLGLRTPLQVALEVLKERHVRAVALCRKERMSCAQLRAAEMLYWADKDLTTDDMATLAMILRTNGLPRLQQLVLIANDFGDAGMQALCEGLGRGSAPALCILGLGSNKIGPVGAEALAVALRGGAMPNLEKLYLNNNPVGNKGVAALAAPLRKLPSLKTLGLVQGCELGDEGMASLFANLGKDDFKQLEMLFIAKNNVTDAGMITLAAALDAGRLTRLRDQTGEYAQYFLQRNPASASAIKAVKDALAKRSQ